MNEKEVFVTNSLIQEQGLYFLNIVNNSLPKTNTFHLFWVMCRYHLSKNKPHLVAIGRAVNRATPTNWEFYGSSWPLDGVWVSTVQLTFSTRISTDCCINSHPPPLSDQADSAAGKKRKERATFLARANYTGTERLPHLVLGKYRNSRCFESSDLAPAVLLYRNSAKGRMTAEFFYKWFIWFDGYIGKTARRRAILLIDNAPCHGQVSTIPILLHTKILFLPKNTTSRIQPLDSGVIACI